MVKKEILPPHAIDALAWLDPSLARQAVRAPDHRQVAESPPSCRSEEAAVSESESAESNTTKTSSPSIARRRRHGWTADILHVLLLAAVGIAVLVALICDSRLYYGIDVDGQPIYQEEVKGLVPR